MKFIRSNIIPVLLTLTVMTGLFIILSYISYDIYSHKPKPVQLETMIKGRIETKDFIENDTTLSLNEFYQPPAIIHTQPELPKKLFTTDDAALYQWLELSPPETENKR